MDDVDDIDDIHMDSRKSPASPEGSRREGLHEVKEPQPGARPGVREAYRSGGGVGQDFVARRSVAPLATS
jgi:hypothetical protein